MKRPSSGRLSPHGILLVSGLLAASLLGTALSAQTPGTVGPLGLEARIRAQAAVERVYYGRRIWPQANPGPKPPFEEAVTRAQLEARVKDSLKRSAALETLWHRPITTDQLQAEIDRMAGGTRAPDVLRELFSALGNDPTLIAECLARPLLTDRLVRELYAFDPRIHAETREAAGGALEGACHSGLASWPEGEYRKVTCRLEARRDTRDGSRDSEELWLDEAAFREAVTGTGTPGQLSLRELPDAFVVERTLEATDEELVLERLVFLKRPFSEWWAEASSSLTAIEPAPSDFRFALPDLSTATSSEAAADSWVRSSLSFPGAPPVRQEHTAVWTGAEMIVWGGNNGSAYLTGGRYTPSTDSWAPTSTGTGCPSARYRHTAVWTGTEMIVWGGRTSLGVANTGGRYNPSTDSWAATSTGSNCPSVREYHSSVWTGTEMIIWGGYGTAVLNTGGRYSPSDDIWTATSTSGCPTARRYHTAVWTGEEMLIWGGRRSSSYTNTGGRYNPSTGLWSATTATGCPTARAYHTAVWTGAVMVVWGGYDGSSYLNSGGRYDPSSGLWTPTSADTGCPAGREWHTAVWTGAVMVVWGGDNYSSSFDTGGRYDPSGDGWSATSTGLHCPSARTLHTAVWTGTEMIVWGGYGDSYLNTGGRYRPSDDSWAPTIAGNSCPSERRFHTAVWTGAEMIVWGGLSDSSLQNTGGRYDPATDTWAPTSTEGNCPSAREWHSAVWTGTEMIVWGGNGASGAVSTGGRYLPASDLWEATSAGADCPTARYDHSAVWTGTEMIVWGGSTGSGRLNTGGRYSPASNGWTATSTGTNCPSIRSTHAAVWTGSVMIVWGGANSSADLNTGGRYRPSDNTWEATSTGTDCPAARHAFTAVWTGAEMIVWGGYASGYSNSGGRYNPSDDSWVATSSGIGCPPARMLHTAVWTGTEMIVWGGQGSSPTVKNDGGRYSPSTSGWAATSTGAECPSVRYSHTAVWADSEMIVWGGVPGTSCFLNTGGRYSPYGCADPSPPVITSVTDNDCSQSGITITFSPGAGASAHKLLVDGSVAASGISSPWPYAPADMGYHTYVVRAVNDCSLVDSTPHSFADGLEAPGAPAFANVTSTGIDVSWTAVPGATAYDVYRMDGSTSCAGAAKVNVSPVLGTSYADSGLVPDTDYAYFIVATNSCASPNGACASQRTDSAAVPPEVAEGTSPEDAQSWVGDVQSWPAVAGATGYRLYRGSLADLPALLTGAENSCLRYTGDGTSAECAETPGGVPGRFYWYLVTAYNGAGEGSAGSATSGARIVNASGSCP